jgi:serine/threonine protein kinase
MKYVHSAGILHRDLKPRNLLVNSNCDLKICDFGLSRADIPELYNAGAMTDYISTRWYRAPELLLGSEYYSTAVDMWSIGCILAELLLRKPFLPGTDTENQLDLVVAMIGKPPQSYITKYSGGKLAEVFSAIPGSENSGNFDETFSGMDTNAVDLLKKMLLWDPEERISIADSLKHPYMVELHYPPDEPTTNPVSAFDFDFELYDLSTDETRQLLYEEIMLYHSSKA